MIGLPPASSERWAISCLRLVRYRAPFWPFRGIELAVSTLRPPYLSGQERPVTYMCMTADP
jgi:hypothetical protein